MWQETRAMLVLVVTIATMSATVMSSLHHHIIIIIIIIVKLREREGQRVDLGRSLKGHLWMVDGGWWYTFP